ncbi:MAG TPA: hypothetical protein VOB72_04175 [Candidatus Dormibacteraeota bacterium]|nr:hypothetical protein [Candidatus Dormibacteraeota bacterium]
MGANLVAQVLTHWTHVSDRAFRVLVRMAVTALDKPKDGAPAAVYFAGRELLAMSLRGGGTEQSRFRIVSRVVAELIEVGAIERTDSGRTGHHAVYRLTLGGTKPADKATDQGGQFSHPKGGQISHPKGGQFGPQRVANLATPRNQEEPLEELKEEERGALTTASHPSRATEPSEEPPSVIPLYPNSANAPDEPPYRAPPRTPSPVFGRRWSTRGMDTIAEATARSQAARAAHQAKLAAEQEIS